MMDDANTTRKAALLWIIALAALLSLNLVASATPNSEHHKKGKVRCIDTERKALLKFKKGLTSQYRDVSKIWTTEECCNWKGVVCSNTTGHVDALGLDGFSIADEISPALLELTHLTRLDLSVNDFMWSRIPEFIGSMKQLEYLSLGNSNFSGMIPPQLGNLINLRRLDLSGNDFMGSRIPEFIGSMKQLEYLSLGNSNFSGMIPPQLGNLTNLHTLDLSENDFMGSRIPEFIGSMKKLEMLNLVSSNFYGMIPPQLGNLTNLIYLDLPNNFLWSEDLSWLSSLSHLSELDLSSSNISDTNWIQPIMMLPSLQFLHLYSCNLEYVVPSPGLFANSSSTSLSLLELDLGNNNLTSSVFDWLFNISTSLVRLDLSDNKLVGTIPTSFSSNRLVGTIPTSFSDLKGLISLNLSRNNFTGNIIPGIGEMEALETLDLSRNQLSGAVPIGMAQLHFLSFLDLANNNLSGPIPSSTQLQSFNASSYAGNDGLCGPPLLRCPNTSNSTEPEEDSDEKGSSFLSLSSQQELFASVFMGFFVGFWGVVASLVLKQSWRSAYYNILNVVGDWFFVNTALFLAKFRRR